MNLCDCVVIEVTGPIKEKYDRWWVPVRYDSYGKESTSEIMCFSKDQAEHIGPGHWFLA